MAHVHVENQNPRTIMGELGFVQRHDENGVVVVQVPDGFPGFGHMPKSANGKVEGHVFDFPLAGRATVFRAIAQLMRDGQFQGNELSLDVPVGMEPAELERLANDIDDGAAV